MRVVLFAVMLLCPAMLRADPPAHAEWELTFRDEFDGTGVNWDVWQSDAAARSAEQLESRWPENNVLRDGILYQATKKEAAPRAGKSWTTAHIWTRMFQQQYGYFEARMRYGRCLNNAFWLFRPLSKRFADPPHFEIDVNEGHTPSDVAMNFHYYFAVEGTKERDRWATGKVWAAPVDLEADFHVYGVEWNKDAIIWYFDGRPVRRLENRWAHAAADVRLSTVIMDRQLQKEARTLDSMDGVSMAVDWVRVYQKKRDLSTPELPELEPCRMPEVVKRDPQVAPGSRKTVLLREDFQSAAVDRLPENWRVGDKQPAVVLETPPAGKKPLSAGNKVLKLEPGDYAFRLFDAPISGRLEMEFDFLAPARKDGLLLSTLGQFDAANPRTLPNSYYTGDIGAYVFWRSRFIEFYSQKDGWTPFARWRGGQWNHVRVLVDVAKGVVDCYGGKEGNEFLGGALFRRRQKAARGIALRHHASTGTVYVDNIVVRKVDDEMGSAYPCLEQAAFCSLEDAAGKKVVCFGDSITKAGYPALLAGKLGVEVANSGLGGHTTAAALPKMQKAVLDHRPDAVVLFFGTNDSRLAEPNVHVPPAKYEANLIEMIDRCRAIRAQPVICTIPPINPEPYFKRHARTNFDAAGGMPKVLAEYRAAALRAARSRKVPVVDLNQLLQQRPEWLAPDGVHPTKQGNAILADLIAEAVAPLLKTASAEIR